MAGSLRFVDLVQNSIDELLAERRGLLDGIADETLDLVDVAGDLLVGGKRFRALFAYWGWHGVAATPRQGGSPDAAIGPEDLVPITRTAAALEVFHAAALVHDDLMDDSDLRRGGPSVHRRFESLRRDDGTAADVERFGRSAALLLGDLLLGWSDELLDLAIAELPRPAAVATRAEFMRMRTEVTVGQYLDVLEELAWRSHPETEQLARAQRVVLYKSAKYSVEAPLVIGASIAGGDERQIAALRGFGVPLGVAFQLRDDLLGVFGDSELTGKPAGDDLREGKRTVLIALARRALPGSATRLLDELLGDRELDDTQIRMLQSTIRESGAVAELEERIAANVRRARAALDDAPLSPSARTELGRLADAVTRRDA